MGGTTRYPRWAVIATRAAAVALPCAILAAVALPVVRWPLVEDVRTVRFPRTEGVVTFSEFKTWPSGGRRYEWALRYTYEIDGTAYTGTHYSPTGDSWYYEKDVGRLAAAFPVGARVPVAYDPDAPATTYLRPGQPGQLFERALFVLLAAGMTGGYVALALTAPLGGSAPAPPPREFDPEDRRQVAHTPDGVRVRLPAETLVHPVLGVVLAGVVGVLIFRNRPTPPDPYPWWAGFLIVVVAPVLGGLLLAPLRRAVVLLDAARSRLVVRGGRLWPRAVVPFDRIAGVMVIPRAYRAKGGPITYYRVAVIHGVTGDVREVTLTEYLNKADADALAGWLRDRLGLPVPG